HPHVDGQRAARRGQRGSQSRRLRLGQLPQRRAPARHLLVVVGDLLQALGRNAPATREDLEERTDLGRPGGAADREGEQGGDHPAPSSWTMSTRAATCSTGVVWWTPWPRLKMCPGRPPARARIAFTRSRNSAGLASNAAGSRL